MNSFRRLGSAAASTALVFGMGLGFPAVAAASAGTVLADASNCTENSVTVESASEAASPPWEVGNANAGHLSDWHGHALDGSGVTVAVVDTGIDGTNPQLSVNDGVVLNGETATGYKADDDGHGTMVASIIAAKPSSADGMQGIAPGVKLLSIREAGCKATAGNKEETMATGITDAVNMGADIINISQDGYQDDPALSSAVQYAAEHGVLIVTSAGNQGDRDTTDSTTNKDYGVNPITFPASYQPYVLAVGAADQYGSIPTFSERGSSKVPFVGVVAPGVEVGALLPGTNKVALDDGTSFAAPYVAGEAALIMQEYGWTGKDARKPARVYEVMKIIEDSADGDGAYSLSRGWGQVVLQYTLQNVKASSSATGLDTNLVSGDFGTGFGTVYGLPVKMYGIGPNADGAASSAKSPGSQVVAKPYVAQASNQTAAEQQRWAYIALGAGLLVAVVTLAGAAVVRDTSRRRRAAQGL